VINEATDDPQYDQTLNLLIENCAFTENQFTGDDSSLIYANGVLVSLKSNTFTNNGRITSDIVSNSKSNASLFATSS